MSIKYLDYTGLSRVKDKIVSLLSGKQDTLVSGTNIKTINSNSILGSGNVSVRSSKTYYGTCSTEASTQIKVVTCPDFVLETGAVINIKFDYQNSYASGSTKLNINSTGAIDIENSGVDYSYEWYAGNMVAFVYDGSHYKLVNKNRASTTTYGTTKLTNSTSSTSISTAATPNSVRTAYDLANNNKNTYSTTETRIGTWVDGKPLYRKCYSVNAFPNNTNIWFSANISNLKQVVFLGGYMQSSAEVFSINAAYNTTYFDTLVYEISGGNAGKIRLHTTGNRSTYSGYVWIEYTKTTD